MFFNSGLKQKVEAARQQVHERLEDIKGLLSQGSLDATLRLRLEIEADTIRGHFRTRIQKINGGS